MVTSFETRSRQYSEDQDASQVFDEPDITTGYNSDYTEEETQEFSPDVTDVPQYDGETEYNDNNNLQEESEYTIVKTFMPNVEKTIDYQPPVIEKVSKETTTRSVVKLNARGKIFACMYGMVATLLVAFCIYNAVSLSNLNKSLDAKKTELGLMNNTINELNVEYSNNTTANKLPDGYTLVSEDNTVKTAVATRPNYVNIEESTNWFDKICNFLSNLFS